MEILDIPTIITLKELMEDEFDLLINSYIEAAQQLVKEIHESFNHANFEILARGMHTLKSSSQNLGALKIAQLAIDLETLVFAKDLPKMIPYIAQLDKTLTDTINALEKQRSAD